jgi:YfiH family protein
MGLSARGQRRFADYEVQWAFTDRYDGGSSPPFASDNLAVHVGDDVAVVQANRVRLAQAMEVPADRVAAMTQVHGSLVVPAHPGAAPEADGIFTSENDLLLLTQVADCVPIVLAGDGGDIAAVHAGWRGVVAGISEQAVQTLIDRGAKRESLIAWVGPAICARCYEVGEDVREQVAAVAPTAFATTASGTPAVDVRAGVLEQLTNAGVATEVIGGCTFEDQGLYSYRRDGQTGRQAGVIVRRAHR